MTKDINVFDVVADIQAKKEQYRITPSYALFYEIKAELEGIDDGTLYALLDAQVDSGLLRRRLVVNGLAYEVDAEL